MKYLMSKIEEIKRLTEEVDGEVWTIFHRYVKQEQIMFNGPEGWEIRDGYINFHGSDGCRGCYDNMSLEIPFKFFADPDVEFPRLAEQRAKEAKEREAKAKAQQNAADRREFERLQKKFLTLST